MTTTDISAPAPTALAATTKPLALHMGVSSANASKIERRLRQHVETVYIDGDGWNVWGEAPGVDDNDDDTLHIVVGLTLDELPLLEGAIRRLHGEWLLSPMGGHAAQVGVIAALTDFDDWSVLHGNVTVTPRAPGIEPGLDTRCLTGPTAPHWDNDLTAAIAALLDDRDDEKSERLSEWLYEHENDDAVWGLIDSLIGDLEALAGIA